MSDKNKFTAPQTKVVKTKRPSTVSVASSSRKVPQSTVKEKTASTASRAKINKNATIIGDADVTICRNDGSAPEFDGLNNQVAYGKFLRTMLQDCIVNEKIEREETEMDIMMSHLADRFRKTMSLLDKTNRRLKDISFVAEQERLLKLKSKDSAQFYDLLDNSNVKEHNLNDLNITLEANLDRLEIKNVDFGYNKDTGHKQLLDAVNDAIDGLETIKKHSDLDPQKFKEYEKVEKNVAQLGNDRLDLKCIMEEFESKFPKYSEKLLTQASEKIEELMRSDDDEDAE